MAGLRPEVLRFPRPDGGMDLLDPLLGRLHTLTASEVRGLEAGSPEVLARLERELLLEGRVADRIREQAWAARAVEVQPAEPPEPEPRVRWELARSLPDIVAPSWRDPERFRRLAEDRRAGRERLVLHGFLEPAFARRLALQAMGLPYTAFNASGIRAMRSPLSPAGPDLPELRALWRDPTVRALFGGLLGRALPDRVLMTAWQLRPRDRFQPHPDGPQYRGTAVVGLCEGWRAEHGGALAFGEPTRHGMDVHERWLPHRGDVLLFAPSARSWHAVEPPTRTRWTISSWWVDPRVRSH